MTKRGARPRGLKNTNIFPFHAFSLQYDLFVQWFPIRLLRGVLPFDFPFDFPFDRAGGLWPRKSNGNIAPKPHST